MDFIQIKGDDELVKYVKDASPCFDKTAFEEWESYTRFPVLHRMPPMSGKLVINDFSLQIKHRRIEILTAFIICRPMIDITQVKGNIQTLSAAFTVSLSNVRVIGDIRIDHTSHIEETRAFSLILKNTEIEFITGLYIKGDDFCVDNIVYKFKNLDINFAYSVGEMVSLDVNEATKICPLNEIADENHKRSMEVYIAEQILGQIITNTKDILKNLVHFDKMPVSNFLGLNYDYRNQLRMHKKKLTLCFDQFLDEVLKLTNEYMISNKTTSIALSDFSGILKILNLRTQEPQRFQLLKGSIDNLATLKRNSTTTIHLDKDQVILVIYIKFNELTVEYKEYIENTLNNDSKPLPIPVEHHGYLKIGIKKVESAIDVSLLEVRILKLIFNEDFREQEENEFVDIDVQGTSETEKGINNESSMEADGKSNKNLNVNLNEEIKNETGDIAEKVDDKTEKETVVEQVDKQSEREAESKMETDNNVNDDSEKVDEETEKVSTIESKMETDDQQNNETETEVDEDASKDNKDSNAAKPAKSPWAYPHLITWINYILEGLTTPLIEDLIVKAISGIVKSETLIPLAVHPTNFENLEDSDAEEDSEDEEEI